MVSTESERIAEIALHYGAEVPFLRPAEFATSVSPDIEWLSFTLEKLGAGFDLFSILRPTSPFRQVVTIHRAFDELLRVAAADSLRAVELVKEHPGKMWQIEGDLMRPLLDQADRDPPWHSMQYQALPEVFVQNSSLELAWTRVVTEQRSLTGSNVVPFRTDPLEGFSLDYEDQWDRAVSMIESGAARLPRVEAESYSAS